ncbi:FkbM family methyltransferase [Erythrobacter sp. NFXS35]|uniref:FkbM family methyltransferase n=1 Tax=Erythrobacter sp. NFXS35 TaxID=2818436 RepID=UPI0032DEB914
MYAAVANRAAWWRTLAFQRVFPEQALRRNLARKVELEQEIELLPLLTNRNKVSIDVGANAGCYAAALLPLSQRVILIEPHPRLARLLRGFPRDRAQVHQAVATDSAGEMIELEVVLKGSREVDALGRVARGPATASARRYRVPTLTLDQFSDQPTGFIKIDVEGHETVVLRGAGELIERHRPNLLIESEARHCEGAPWSVFEWTAQHGYEGFFCYENRVLPVDRFSIDMQDTAPLPGQMRRHQANYANNFIFVPRERDWQAVAGCCEAALNGREYPS